MIFHTTDWHLDHKNILRFDKRPDVDIEAMNKRVIETANAQVGASDWLIYGGDLVLNNELDRDDNDAYVARVKHFLDQLVCKNIIFIGGNHDKVYTRRHGLYLPNWPLWDLFQTRYECPSCGDLWSPGGRFGLPRACRQDCPNRFKVVGHRPIYDIHPMGYELRLTRKLCADHGIPNHYDGMHIFCTHYSMRVWNKSHHSTGKGEHLGRAINLYGHSHGGLPGIKNSFDLAFNVHNRILSLLEILTRMMPEHNQKPEAQVYFGHHEG